MWESLYAERELLVAFYGSLKSNLYETVWFPNFTVEDFMICKQFCCTSSVTKMKLKLLSVLEDRGHIKFFHPSIPTYNPHCIIYLAAGLQN